MKKNLILLAILLLLALFSLNFFGALKKYYDDRTTNQKNDSNVLEHQDYFLNLEKKVILFGVDGLEFEKLPNQTKEKSNFEISFKTQSYESYKGWSSIFWGSILENTTNVFNLIKQKSKGQQVLKNAVSIQYLGASWINYLFRKPVMSAIDNFVDDEAENLYDVKKIQQSMNQLIEKTHNLVDQKFNFIFSYNGFYDELKHDHYENDDPLVATTIQGYNDIWTNFLDTYGSDPNYLLLMVTDHGRNLDGYNHSRGVPSAHRSWVLANQNLDFLLGTNRYFLNLYDLRTVIINWLKF